MTSEDTSRRFRKSIRIGLFVTSSEKESSIPRCRSLITTDLVRLVPEGSHRGVSDESDCMSSEVLSAPDWADVSPVSCVVVSAAVSVFFSVAAEPELLTVPQALTHPISMTSPVAVTIL